MKTARVGMWTPWASVLCAVCDYDALQGTERATSYAAHFAAVSKMQRDALVTRPDGDLEATCDKCKCACWVRDDVALLQAVGFAAAGLDWNGPFGWELQQTGGMCAALVFTTGFSREVVATAMDGWFVLGEYVQSAESYWDRPLRMWESAPICDSESHELVSDARLAQLVGECARQATEFIHNPTPEPCSDDAVAARLALLREEHRVAAGSACSEGPDGMCSLCGAEMTTCATCGGFAYHRKGCPRIDGAE